MKVLKVATASNPNSVAGAIANTIKDYGEVEIHAIGAGAVNQTVKAIAIARGFMAPLGMDLTCVPAFLNLVIEDLNRSGMKFIVRGA